MDHIDLDKGLLGAVRWLGRQAKILKPLPPPEE